MYDTLITENTLCVLRKVSVDVLCCIIATEEDLCSMVETFGEKSSFLWTFWLV